MYDVIIIGGSYAGLSAALALGRSLRNTLVIDSGKPCNRFTPHSHNFLAHDGQIPAEISAVARSQIMKYETVRFYEGFAIKAEKVAGNHFVVTTSADKQFTGKKLILATGLKDIIPDIPGFAACWGISIIHCPYCHGYEYRNEITGIFGNGEVAYHYAQLTTNLTDNLIIFTNGKASFTGDQTGKINAHNIDIVETEVKSFEHLNGEIKKVILQDSREIQLRVLYARPEYEQHSGIVKGLGCQVNDQGLIEVDGMQKTSVPGVFACGDNSGMRAVSVAVASGTKAGAMVNFALIEEGF